MALYTVTGAAGFIGSHLVDALLSNGHKVRALDDLSTGHIEHLDPRCELITGDVADPAMVHEALDGADGCFHLAAIASVQRANEDWLATNRVNQAGTITVLDAARKYGGIPVVYASSAAIYGDLGTGIAHEDALPAPLTAYGADKLSSELHARVAFVVHGVPTLGLRFFNVYGPRQDPSSAYSGVISIFARRIARHLAITVNGEGDQVRDFIHVSDVVEHLVAGMKQLLLRPGASVLNVCTGKVRPSSNSRGSSATWRGGRRTSSTLRRAWAISATRSAIHRWPGQCSASVRGHRCATASRRCVRKLTHREPCFPP